MHGIIVLNQKQCIVKSNNVDINGKDIIVIQTKASRLEMYLMGQAFFAKELELLLYEIEMMLL